MGRRREIFLSFWNRSQNLEILFSTKKKNFNFFFQKNILIILYCNFFHTNAGIVIKKHFKRTVRCRRHNCFVILKSEPKHRKKIFNNFFLIEIFWNLTKKNHFLQKMENFFEKRAETHFFDFRDFGRFWSKIWILVDFGEKPGFWSILVKNLDFGPWP